MPTRIDPERCTHCGDCVFHCGALVYAVTPERTVRAARPGACAHCLLCVERCREGAISVVFPRAGGVHRPAGREGALV